MLLFFEKGVGFHLNAWGAFFDNNTVLPALIIGAKYLTPIVWSLIFSAILLVLTQLYYKKHEEHYWDHTNE